MGSNTTILKLLIFGVIIFQVLTQSTAYNIDDSTGVGRRFDGIGAISGGGATSKLLINYPKQQRNEILDFLFKPNYGASFHMLKVEIGGDAQSSDGGEATHMRDSHDENYQRGYEWWLMTEAKKRNPDLLLFGLPWAFPAWIGNGTFSAYANPEVTAEYITKWINGAQTHYNLKVDYIGIWNERNYSSIYIKTLRKTLDRHGLQHVKICAPDDLGWQIAEAILADSDLSNSVDSIGSHYPETVSTSEAIRTGKRLWASEDHGGYNDIFGASCHAKMINENYVNGYMTSTISWNLIASFYEGLPHYRTGIMTALEPWSGNYMVNPPVWATAHTTQFTKPGWRYLSHGSGVGNLTGGGSYVTFTDTNTNDVTIVIETSSCPIDYTARGRKASTSSVGRVTPQMATFKIGGTYAHITSLDVWFSKFDQTGKDSTIFKQRESIQVVNGEIVLTLGVDEVWTLTTVGTGRKGSAPDPPPSQPFPLPYTDDFDSYTPPTEPYNLAQQVGIWEVVDIGAPRHGIIRQVVTEHPVYWCWGGNVRPGDRTINVAGNYNWTDIHIQIDARVGQVNATDGLFVAARVDRGGCHINLALGIFFFIYPQKQLYYVTSDLEFQRVLQSGPASINTDWNTLGLNVQGNHAVGFLNGKQLFNVTVSIGPANGFVGFGTDPYGLADFDNLEIRDADKAFSRMRNDSFHDETLFFKADTN